MPRGLMEKTRGNAYAEARLKAAQYNEKLKSRESAAYELGITTNCLSNYELGLSKVVPNDVVMMMSIVYNAPELLNHYCVNECPIGRETQHELALKPVSNIAVQLANRVAILPKVNAELMSIIDDGQITEDEEPILKSIYEKLDEFQKIISEFKLFCEKNKLV